MKLVIKNGTIINPAKKQHETGDVVIENGKIISLGGKADTAGGSLMPKGCLWHPVLLICMSISVNRDRKQRKISIPAHRRLLPAESPGWLRWPIRIRSLITWQFLKMSREEWRNQESLRSASSVLFPRIWKASSFLKWAIWLLWELRLSPMTDIMWKVPISCGVLWNTRICWGKWSSIMQRI